MGLCRYSLGRPLQHSQFRGFCAHGKQLENGEHAAGRHLFAIDKAQGIGDRVPHPLEAALIAPMAAKPISEADPIQGSNRAHPAIKVDEATDNRARPPAPRNFGAYRAGTAGNW